jgi:hypothetical protein
MCVYGFCQTADVGGQTVIENAFVVGGTSVSTPSMAGIMALLEQKNGQYQGMPNYTFYQLAAAENLSTCNSSTIANPAKSSTCVFYDVTVGNNGAPGQPVYQAGTGYDMATGLGSMNAANLVAGWSSARKLATTTAMAAGVTTVKHGEAFPLAITVNPAKGHGVPSGDFSFVTDGFGSAFGGTLTNGAFAGNVSALPGGTYNFSAHYAGDAMFAGSNSNNVPIRVTPEASAVSLVAYTMLLDGNPVPIIEVGNHMFYAFPLGFEIDVHGKSGVGAVSGKATLLLDGTTKIATVPLAQGASGFFTVFNDPLPGQHHVTAVYSGDNSFQSGSVEIPLLVKKGSVLGYIDTSPTTLTAGTPVKLFVSLYPLQLIPGAPVLPTGTVSIRDNGRQIAGPLPLADHGLLGTVAQTTYVANLAAGLHSLSLTYSGDSNYELGRPRTFDVTVNPPTGAASVLTMKQSPNVINVGQSANYVMTVRPETSGGPTPTGTVTLISVDDIVQSPPVPLVNGSATFTQPYYASGVFLNMASYSGDSNYSPSNSINLLIRVNQLVPTVTLAAAQKAVKAGQRTSVTVSAVGHPADPNLNVPAGQVQFFDAVNGASERRLGPPQYLTIGNGGNAVYTLPVVFAAGEHVLRAEYLGSVTAPDPTDLHDWAPASSNRVTVSVH